MFTFKVLTLLKLVKTVRCAECLSFCVIETWWLRHFVVGVKLQLFKFISAVSKSWISFTCDVSGSSSTPFGGNTCLTLGRCSIMAMDSYTYPNPFRGIEFSKQLSFLFFCALLSCSTLSLCLLCCFNWLPTVASK